MNNMNIEQWYEHRCRERTDINEHLPRLFELAQECDHITELGTAGLHSTWAFLMARPKKFITVDILAPESRPGVRAVLDQAQSLAEAEGVDFQFIQADTTAPEFQLEPTDLLFIDTYHVYEHLKKELAQHSHCARKYIVLHDTTTFADHGEVNSYDSQVKPEHRTQPRGLWPAVLEFLEDNPHWQILERRTNNNGLTILRNHNE
jgi:hypothetical protein